MKIFFSLHFLQRYMDVKHGCPMRKRHIHWDDLMIYGQAPSCFHQLVTGALVSACGWNLLFSARCSSRLMDVKSWMSIEEETTSLRQLGPHSWVWALIIHHLGYWLDMLFYMPKIIQWMVRMDGYLFTPNKQLLLTIRIVFIFIYFYFFIFFWTAQRYWWTLCIFVQYLGLYKSHNLFTIF